MQSFVVRTALTALVLAGCSGVAVIEPEHDADPQGSGGSGGAPVADAGAEDAAYDAGAPDVGAPAADAGPGPLCPMDGVKTAQVGYLGGECGGIMIGVSGLPTFPPESWSEPSPPRLSFGRYNSDPVTGYLGGGEAEVTVTINGQSLSTKGWLDLTRVDPMPEGPVDPGMEYPRIEGTITVKDNGWSVAGSFTALYCNWMDILCP